MSITKNFVTGYYQSDVDFFNNCHDGLIDPSGYELKGDIIISASRKPVNQSHLYEPVKLTNSFSFDGKGRTISIVYDGCDKFKANTFRGIFDIIYGKVKNINVKIEYVILRDYCGWIDTSHFGTELQIISSKITNCSVEGDVQGTYSGGIVGACSGRDKGQSQITRCKVEGNVCGKYAGGIAGAWAGQNGQCIVIRCELNGGILGDGAGGIVGSYAGFSKGICLVENSKSTKNIVGQGSGGIIGSYAGEGGYARATNCGSYGKILGDGAGGIIGIFAGHNGTCQVINCTSSGCIGVAQIGGYGRDNCDVDILNGMGGIVGSNAGNFGLCQVINCSTSGQIDGVHSGGIAARYAGNNGECDITNCSTSGDINGDNCGGIVGSDASDIVNKSSCKIFKCVASGDVNSLNSGGIAGGCSGFVPETTIPAPTTTIFSTTTAMPETTSSETTVISTNSDLVIDNCIVTSKKVTDSQSSGKIIGSYSYVILTNTYFYVNYPQTYLFEIAGSSTEVIEDPNNPNHPVKTIEAFLLNDKCNCNHVCGTGYDGIQAITIDDPYFDFGIQIQCIDFNKDNNHPFQFCCDLVIPTQMQEAYEAVGCKYPYLKFTSKNKIVEKTVRFWIPNAYNSDKYTYSVHMKVKNSFVKLGDLSAVDDGYVSLGGNDVKASNIFELMFPEDSCAGPMCSMCPTEYNYYVFKNPTISMPKAKSFCSCRCR